MNKNLSRRFSAVLNSYAKLYNAREAEGKGLYTHTRLGAWATSRATHVFYFFKKIDLGRYNLFLDLGSGDGVVTCIAGLFTRSAGIEVDEELCGIAQKAARDLGLGNSTSFIRADFLTQNITKADCLYIYPDKPFYALEDLLSGWRGTLLVYGPHMPPKRMQPAATFACARERLTLYLNPKSFAQ